MSVALLELGAGRAYTVGVMRKAVRIIDVENFAASHPWLAALPFSVVAAIVCSVIALATASHPATPVAIPVFLLSWVVLGSHLRNSRLGG
jgi:hypothetical protein